MSKFDTHVDPIPDFERFIGVIIRRVMKCEKHPHSESGMPCYRLPSDKPQRPHGLDMANYGVCNWRARQAGFVGIRPAPKARVNSQFNRS